MIGISFLFDADFRILLSFCVMAPVALRVFRARDHARTGALKLMDTLLLAYCALTSVFFIHTEIKPGVLMSATPTDCLRRAFEAFFSLVVPYYVISRSSKSREALLDTLASYCLGCGLLAAIAIFEGTRGWLLYDELSKRWSPGGETSYLFRAGSVRAMASTGHSLALGYFLAIAYGFWLPLQAYVKSATWRWAVTSLLWLGLIAAYARGPWMGAVVIYLAFAALRPRALSGLLKAAGAAALLSIPLALSSLGDRIARVLPFLGGKVDSNILYRQALFDRSWQIIQQSPLFGDPYALLKMQDLRQGEGIIDLVNAYVVILLNNGFIGLFVYVSFIFIALVNAWSVGRQPAQADSKFSSVGAGLVACILGTLLMIAFCGSSDLMICILAALAAAYARLGTARAAADVAAPAAQQTG
jgi:O-antigen ligase